MGGPGIYGEGPEDGDKFVKYTEDCGLTWEGIDIPPDADLWRRFSSHPDGSFFDIYGSHLARIKRTADGHWGAEKHVLPSSIERAQLHIEGEVVWLIAFRRSDRGESIFRLKGSGEFERLGAFPLEFSIDAISSHDSVITVVGGGNARWDYSPPPSMTVFRSYNDGKTWHSEKPRILRRSTVAFLGSHIWTIGSGNRIHYRR